MGSGRLAGLGLLNALGERERRTEDLCSQPIANESDGDSGGGALPCC
jgi:hypothetical protein